MFNKKNSALLLAAGALVAGGLASCNGGGSGPSLSIWCPGTDEKVINEIVASFKETYEDYADWNIYIDQTIGEGDTQAVLVQDKTASADIICMADDNLRTAVQSNTVLPVDAADAAGIAESDGQDAVDSLSINGTLYGYPYRMDNSYLLFYDTTIYSQEDIKSLDSIPLIAFADIAGADSDYADSVPCSSVDSVFHTVPTLHRQIEGVQCLFQILCYAIHV